jgi:hypothetical protein
MANRMRVKSRNKRGDAAPPRVGNGGPNNGQMPGMDAIEIAKRHHAAAKFGRDRRIAI